MGWESYPDSFCHFLSPEIQFNRSVISLHVFWFSEEIYVFII